MVVKLTFWDFFSFRNWTLKTRYAGGSVGGFMWIYIYIHIPPTVLPPLAPENVGRTGGEPRAPARDAHSEYRANTRPSHARLRDLLSTDSEGSRRLGRGRRGGALRRGGVRHLPPGAHLVHFVHMAGRPRKERERSMAKVAYRLDPHFNRAKLARELGVSTKTVIRAIEELKAQPLIEDKERLRQLMDVKFLGHEAQARRYARLALRALDMDPDDPQEVHRLVRDVAAMGSSLGLSEEKGAGDVNVQVNVPTQIVFECADDRADRVEVEQAE